MDNIGNFGKYYVVILHKGKLKLEKIGSLHNTFYGHILEICACEVDMYTCGVDLCVCDLQIENKCSIIYS